MRRKAIAQETIGILERGGYTGSDGREIDLSAALRECIDNTRCYEPDELAGIREHLLAQPVPFGESTFEVVNETTLQGAARLATAGRYRRIGVLNFASAKNPGGGFLGGAQAQEESLARSSALYSSLLECRAYYSYHRTHRSCLYSDRMIYSPACPVFREDDGALLGRPYRVDFITSPAPNAGAIRRNEPSNVDKIEGAFDERGSKLLALAASRGCDALVLGAWGCGVFQNDPAMVAAMFRAALGPGGPFWARFHTVRFSVLDKTRDQATYHAFASRFGDRHRTPG